MKSLGLFCLVLVCMVPPIQAADTVTIPKSRLEELERKAAELDRLKSQTSAPPAIPGRPTAQPAPSSIAIPGKPSRREHSPLPSLPPLKEGELVLAEDLANHYYSDPVGAQARYGNKKIRVQGEVVGFDRVAFVRDYQVLLQTSERGVRIVCNFAADAEWRSVYSIQNGSELVANLKDYSRRTLARVGDQLIIEGVCKGVKGLNVRMSSCKVKTQP